MITEKYTNKYTIKHQHSNCNVLLTPSNVCLFSQLAAFYDVMRVHARGVRSWQGVGTRHNTGNNLLSSRHCWESRWTFKSCTNACNDVTHVDENSASVNVFILPWRRHRRLIPGFSCPLCLSFIHVGSSRYRSVWRLHEYKIRILALYVQ